MLPVQEIISVWDYVGICRPGRIFLGEELGCNSVCTGPVQFDLEEYLLKGILLFFFLF